MAHILYSAGTTGPQGEPGAPGNDGAQGAIGSQGVTGAQGTNGAQGTTGTQGANGSNGAQGATGPQGVLGVQGATGLQGANGLQGLTGSQGSQGAQGENGPMGSTGPTGAQGTTGAQGETGIQGATGSKGAQGSIGETGAQGFQGQTGVQGYIGAQGYTGLAGAQGAQGLMGNNGYTGAQGIQGIQGGLGSQGFTGAGVQGSTGTQGIQGTQGTTGPAGAGGAVGYYGNFYDDSDQSTSANTPTAIKFNHDFGSNGVSVQTDGTNPTRITFANSGTYNIQFSAEYHNTGGGGSGQTVQVWFKKNGVNVANSNTYVTVNTNSPYIVAAWNFVDTVTAGDYYQLMWQTDNANIILDSFAATTNPAVPSVILTATQVSYSIQGTQGTTGAQGIQGSSGTVAGSANQVVYKDGTNTATGSANLTFNGTDVSLNGKLNVNASSGDEGGEIFLNKAVTNTSINGGVTIDVYRNKLRFFEQGGNARGISVDLTQTPDGVGGEILFKASGFVNAGVDVQLGNLKARIPTSGNRSLQVSTVSGTYTIYGSSVYSQNGVSGSTIDGGAPRSVTTTPTYLNSGYNFVTAGATDTWILRDASNTIAWRITMVIGSGYNNNFISIEDL